jgi:hypothetical protein
MLNPAGFAARESTVPYGLAVATAQKWAMLTFVGCSACAGTRLTREATKKAEYDTSLFRARFS